MTCAPDRQTVLDQVQAAVRQGASETSAARVAGVSQRTLRRWKNHPEGDRRPKAARPTPAHAIRPEEEARILEVCKAPEFASKPPGQIVPALADRGEYIASERTFYRVLHRHRLAAHRGRARTPRARKAPPTHTATAPRQVWVWDITWLAGPVKGLFYRLYIILDLFSRKIVAWEIWETENADNSECLLRRAALAEGIAAGPPVVLHGDNGSPLKAGTLLALMQTLGILPSHSRPRVSNDNAHAEAFFRTAKYAPSLPPGGFASLQQAREWADTFIRGYNDDHLHSAIGYVTPSQKHDGLDLHILAQRRDLYRQARQQNPSRGIKGSSRSWKPVTSTTLNPINPRTLEKELKKSA